ncbi:MAG: hypothetical protein KC729_09520 [Candidatus Eisenbacteria bacterium]|uniref:DUF3568 family protein n=1 Tax=Eiseniibacteriota bacterium TaxID=2212470 RepID=A0A956LZ73_UNCEI|nr:hypothetical protein [Candidatus Eisenbacteria bacterium]
MFLRIRGPVAAAVLVSFVVSLTGCAKRVEVPDGAFEAQQKVVLTFAGDREVQGRIDTASGVRYVDQGSVYRARVRSVSEDSIVLSDLVLVQSAGSVEEVSSRLSDSRVSVSDDQPEIRLDRTDIQRVDLLRFDGTRTLRNLSFWSFSGAVLTMLLGERS